jgi:hypothetical protein
MGMIEEVEEVVVSDFGGKRSGNMDEGVKSLMGRDGCSGMSLCEGAKASELLVISLEDDRSVFTYDDRLLLWRILNNPLFVFLILPAPLKNLMP